MDKVTNTLANKLGIYLEEYTEYAENAQDLFDRHARGKEKAIFIEIYTDDPEEYPEWHVRYIREGDNYKYAGHIFGEDYPNLLKGGKSFRSFLKDFAMQYKNTST